MRRADADSDGNRHPDDALLRLQLASVIEPIECRDQFRRRLKTLLQIWFDAPGDERIERLWNCGNDGPDGWGRVRQPALQLADGAHRILGSPPAHEHVVDDQSERVHVGALVDVLAARLFRGHVFDGPDDLSDNCGRYPRHIVVDRDAELTGGSWRARGRATASRCRSRDPEVHDDRVLVLDHHVRRLEVPMDDARIVRGLETGGDLPGDRQDLRYRAASSHAGPSRDPTPRCTAS